MSNIEDLKELLDSSCDMFDIILEPEKCNQLVDYINRTEELKRYMSERIEWIIGRTDDESILAECNLIKKRIESEKYE